MNNSRKKSFRETKERREKENYPRFYLIVEEEAKFFLLLARIRSL